MPTKCAEKITKFTGKTEKLVNGLLPYGKNHKQATPHLPAEYITTPRKHASKGNFEHHRGQFRSFAPESSINESDTNQPYKLNHDRHFGTTFTPSQYLVDQTVKIMMKKRMSMLDFNRIATKTWCSCYGVRIVIARRYQAD